MPVIAYLELRPLMTNETPVLADNPDFVEEAPLQVPATVRLHRAESDGRVGNLA